MTDRSRRRLAAAAVGERKLSSRLPPCPELCTMIFVYFNILFLFPLSLYCIKRIYVEEQKERKTANKTSMEHPCMFYFPWVVPNDNEWVYLQEIKYFMGINLLRKRVPTKGQ